MALNSWWPNPRSGKREVPKMALLNQEKCQKWPRQVPKMALVIKTIQRQEERTRKQFEESRNKIQAALKKPGTAPDLGNLGPM